MGNPRADSPSGAGRAQAWSPDEVQRAVVGRAPGAGHLLVVGAPGSGKTTTAIAAFEARLTSGDRADGGEALFLAPTRRAAARVRDRLSTSLERTLGRVLVRTPASYAFSLLRARAALGGEPTPTLISGPEQDAILAELLEGHRLGIGAAPAWPPAVSAEARALPAFRAELRDLLMRAAEAGLDADGLAELGRRRGRAEWVAAAAVQREYLQVLRLAQSTPDRGARFDAATLVDEAVAALGAWPSGSRRPGAALVVVDDLQDHTLATARLLGALVDLGAEVLLFGDADAAVQGFRGGTASLIGSAGAGRGSPGGFAAETVVLPNVWRQVPELRAVTRAATEELGTAGGEAPLGAEVAVVRTRALEASIIATLLREEHLKFGTPYSRMAVLARGGRQVAVLRRLLAERSVPVSSNVGETALRDEPAVRPLLAAAEIALGAPADAQRLMELLLSVLLGPERLDTVALRSLRRALQARSAQAGGSAEELLVEAVVESEVREWLPQRLRRATRRLGAILAAGTTAARTPGATAETVLWAIWAAAGPAEPWRSVALAGGSAGERADADLDAVLALFRAAEQFTDRNPAARPVDFLRHLEAQALPADSLAARGLLADAVEVATAAAAAGREWDVVVVAGVQEDQWPDLRIRDSLLGAQALAELASGRAGPATGSEPGRARREVLADELRSFVVAVSRARRRLLVTAVRDSDLAPSPFLEYVEPPADPDAPRPITEAGAPFDLSGLVARLRAEVPDGPDAQEAARLLARLAARGVRGADPETWPAALAESTAVPLWEPGEEVELSPSGVESARRCALRWALERAGGRTSATDRSREIGTLIHAIAADFPHGTESELLAELDRRWPAHASDAGWVARRQREQAEAAVRRLAGYLGSRPGEVRTEVPVSAAIAGVRVRGRVDRLEIEPDGSVRVVDLKTGKSAKSARDAAVDPQLGSYQAAVAAGALGEGLQPAGAALVYVGVNNVRAAIREQGRPEDGWVEALLAEVARTAAAAEFPATVGEACGSCPVRDSCPAQPDGARVSG